MPAAEILRGDSYIGVELRGDSTICTVLEGKSYLPDYVDEIEEEAA